MLRAIWQVWTSKTDDPSEEEHFHMPLHFLRCQEAVTFEARVRADRNFKCIKRRDWKKWIQRQIAEKVDNVQKVRSADLFKILQPKQMIARSNGKLIRQLPGLCGGDGKWKCSRDEIALEWQTQFGNIENAEIVAVDDLLQRSVAKQDVTWQASDLLAVPSLYQLESAIRALQAGKATGLDGLGAEILQVHCQKAFPSLVKGCSAGAEHHGICWRMATSLVQGKRQPTKHAGISSHFAGVSGVKGLFKSMETIDNWGIGKSGKTYAMGRPTRTLNRSTAPSCPFLEKEREKAEKVACGDFLGHQSGLLFCGETIGGRRCFWYAQS